MPDKDKFRQISQNRHYASLRKKIFCYWCQMYQNNSHICHEAECWFNIDHNNLIFIRAETRAGAERLQFWDRSGPRAEVFPTRKDMNMKLYNESYWKDKEMKERQEWKDKEKKERQEWLKNQRAIATRMRPEEWEQYIRKQWGQYIKKQYIKQLDIESWESDFKDLIY